MGFELHQPLSRLEPVNEFTTQMKNMLEEAKAALTKAKDEMAKYYNLRHGPTPTFQPRDKVFLDADDIQTTRPSKKFAHRRLGPYTIEHKVGTHAYKLHLPISLRRLHPVFNVIKLTPAPKDPISRRIAPPPPPPELIKEEEEYEVEKILDSRMFAPILNQMVRLWSRT